jgi:hypothetical protein
LKGCCVIKVTPAHGRLVGTERFGLFPEAGIVSTGHKEQAGSQRHPCFSWFAAALVATFVRLEV